MILASDPGDPIMFRFLDAANLERVALALFVGALAVLAQTICLQGLAA